MPVWSNADISLGKRILTDNGLHRSLPTIYQVTILATRIELEINVREKVQVKRTEPSCPTDRRDESSRQPRWSLEFAIFDTQSLYSEQTIQIVFLYCG
jgi:hypothetical protein